VLPRRLRVPGAGFGVSSPGRLFPAARVEAALAAMAAAYRRVVSPSATVAEFLGAFTEALVLPGGPLHGDAAFTGAYRVYTGTILATYAILEAENGCLAFDFMHTRPVTAFFSPAVRAFYSSAVARGHLDVLQFCPPGPDGQQVEIVFPDILDTGFHARSMQASGDLGAYSQIAVWEALDRTPAEMARLGLEVWEASATERSYDVVFPVDDDGATSPAPLDFAIDPARLVPGARVAEGVVLGTASMMQGVRIRPEIADLWAAMAHRGAVPAVVSATHTELVRAVVDRHYGFSGFPVTGMRPALEAGRYTGELTAPAPYRPGKVDAACILAREVTGDEETRPFLCAGDTTTDLEMLAYASSWRLFFDRGKRPLMDLADHLRACGLEGQTIVQPPF